MERRKMCMVPMRPAPGLFLYTYLPKRMEDDMLDLTLLVALNEKAKTASREQAERALLEEEENALRLRGEEAEREYRAAYPNPSWEE